jgi:prevent-host-death family protein
MSKTVTLRDANQNFAKYVREVEAGEEIVITRRGEPVAKLSAVSGRRVLTPEQEAALERTRKRKRAGRWESARSIAIPSMTAERVTLDSNLLVYSVDNTAGIRNRLAARLVLECARIDCVLSTQSLSEFFHATTRKGKLDRAIAADQVRDSFRSSRRAAPRLQQRLTSISMEDAGFGMAC